MKLIFSLLISMLALETFAQTVIPLYSDGVLGLKPNLSISEESITNPKDGITRKRQITEPSLTVFKPKNNPSKASVIICPGGGYHILAWDHEGTSVGEWFAQRGVTAFVLKYRLPDDEMYENAEIRPLQDAQQAIVYVRKNAAKYGLNESKVGIMGFSAGGHLASTAATHFNTQVGELTDDKISVRPDFTILMYPVISLSDRYAHMGSRNNLIGENPSIEKIEFYSNELQVSAETPPAFLVHAFDDGVRVENSIEYYKALKKFNVPSEMHLYDAGGHGFSMKKSNKGPVATWPNRLEDWMKAHKWM